MPGPFTHIYAARRVADLLSQQGAFAAPGDGPLAPGQPLANPSQAAFYAQVMHTYPKLASLGAIGPDMFFFLGDLRSVPGDEFMLLLRMGYQLDTWSYENWGPLIKLLTSNGYEKAHPWSAILALILQIDAAWEVFSSAYQQAVAPVVDGFENLANAITGDLLQSLSTALQEFLNTIEGLIASMALDSTDVLGYFKLIMESGEDETAFYWSDMLHYRRTSQMAQALLRRAEQMITQNQAQGEQFLAYALGYACHLGVDVVGHAFVNEQAGGPYRTHWQRHHLVENHLDAWVYSQTVGPTLPWSLAGNVEGKNGSPWNFGNVSGCPFFTGNFTGTGKQEIMFYYPGDGNWWLASFTGTAMSWTLACNTSGFGNPWQSVPNEFQRPWAYPSTMVTGGANTTENAPTRAGPFAAGALPDALLLHNENASNGVRLSYESASSPADSDAITASGAFASASAGGVSPLGDCVRFAAYLIGRLTAAGPPPADFNLDAARC